jgi:hypothetical protein
MQLQFQSSHYKPHLRVSLIDIKKEFQMAGKGDNETLEIVNPLEHTQSIKTVTGTHVPENGGT